MSTTTCLKVIDVYCQLIAKMLEDAEDAGETGQAAKLYAQARYELDFVAKSLERVT